MKKIKLVENINEKESKDNSLKNLNQNKNKNDNYNMVMHKINKITVSIENKVLNEQVNDSNEAVEDNRDNVSVNLICDKGKIIGKDQKVNLAIKETICKEVNENNHDKSVNSSNDHNICFTGNIQNNSYNDLNRSNSSSELNKSISDKLVIVKNSDPDSNNDKIKKNKEYVDNNDNDSVIIVSDSNSDIFDDEDEVLNVELVNETFNKIQKFNGKNFSYFLKLFDKSPMLFKQFDSYCTQKMIGIFTEKCGMGELRSELDLIISREKYWWEKYRDLDKKMKELKNLVDLHNKDLMIDKNARPRLCRKTVGIQACITTLNESNIQAPNLSIQQSVDITTDDDKDDIIDLDSVEFSPKPSTSKTTGISNRQLPPLSIITPTPPPPPNIIKPSTVLLSNIVSPRIMNITNDNGTIDLTESDDNIIDITNTRNVEKSPIKIVKNQTINACNIKSGTSPQLTPNLSAQVVPTSVTLIEIPKLPTSSSSYVVSTGSSQLSTNLNPRSSSRAVKPVLTSDGRIVSIQIAPRTIQSAAIANTAHQLPGPSTVTGSLLPVPLAIPIYNHPAKLPPLPAQRSLPNWKKIPPSPVVTIFSKPTDNQRGLVITWDMCLNNSIADISTYQIYAYHEVNTELPRRENWRKVGEVNALPLPMTCSLTQFAFGENYHFAVRAVDIHSRFGPFSDPKSLYNSITGSL